MSQPSYTSKVVALRIAREREMAAFSAIFDSFDFRTLTPTQVLAAAKLSIQRMSGREGKRTMYMVNVAARKRQQKTGLQDDPLHMEFQRLLEQLLGLFDACREETRNGMTATASQARDKPKPSPRRCSPKVLAPWAAKLIQRSSPDPWM